jgi:glycosyltransferase involved in cell wall biosynthesis
MITRPLVSVIIPLFNAEKYISEAIRSAIGQTWANIEVIVVDDGSTDNSLALARAFETDNVKIFHQENKGASAARNLALTHSKGEFIQFLDADDLISPRKIEAQLNRLAIFPGHICCCSSVFFFDNEDHLQRPVAAVGFQKEVYGGDEFLTGLFGFPYGGMVPMHSWLTPASVIKKAGRWNEGLSVNDDGEFFCRAVLSAKGVINCEDSVSYYRKHRAGGSLSAGLSREAYHSMLTAMSLQHAHLLQKSKKPADVNRLFARKYFETGVAAYPQYRDISRDAINKSVAFGNENRNYLAGPVSTALSRIIGWKAIRILTYLRFGV